MEKLYFQLLVPYFVDKWSRCAVLEADGKTLDCWGIFYQQCLHIVSFQVQYFLYRNTLISFGAELSITGASVRCIHLWMLNTNMVFASRDVQDWLKLENCSIVWYSSKDVVCCAEVIWWKCLILKKRSWWNLWWSSVIFSNNCQQYVFERLLSNF